MRTKLTLVVIAGAITASAAIAWFAPVKVAAQRKELPSCFPNCGVTKQDVAWIQHRIAGHDHE